MLADRDRPGSVIGSGMTGEQDVLGVRDGLVEVAEVPHPLGRIGVRFEDGGRRVDQHGLHAVGSQPLARGEHHLPGHRGGLVDTPDVQDDHVQVVGVPGELADHGFGPREQQVAVQLVDPGPLADPQQQLVLGRAPAAPGRPVDHVVGRPDRRPRGPADVHEVQLQVPGQPPAGGDTAHAVAVPVQPGREHGQPELAGQHGEDAAAHPALGRQADLGDPVAGRVVHAAGGHHRQHPLVERRIEHPVAADRPNRTRSTKRSPNTAR